MSKSEFCVTLSLIFIGVIFFFAWLTKNPPLTPYRLDDVQGIFMHEPKKFSFLCRNGNRLKLITLVSQGEKPSEFVLNLKDNEPIYVTCKKGEAYPYDPATFSCSDLEIHLHSTREIQGAEWDHGKHGQGQTTVLPLSIDDSK